MYIPSLVFARFQTILNKVYPSSSSIWLYQKLFIYGPVIRSPLETSSVGIFLGVCSCAQTKTNRATKTSPEGRPPRTWTHEQ